MNEFKNLVKNNPNKTLLVQYEGGGYDGCHWEWNYAVLQVVKGELTYTSFKASGIHGAETLAAFENRYNEILEGRNWNNEAIFIYDANSEKSLREFYTESNPQDVRCCISKLDDEIDEWGEFYPECPVCKNDVVFGYDDMILGDFSGNGGIGVPAHSWHCLECDSLYHCSNCQEFDLTSEYRSELEIKRINTILGYNVQDDDICDTCYKIYLDELEEKEEKHNAQQAKNEVIDSAFYAGIPISAWYDYFDGIACQNILTGEIYAKIIKEESEEEHVADSFLVEIL